MIPKCQPNRGGLNEFSEENCFWPNMRVFALTSNYIHVLLVCKSLLQYNKHKYLNNQRETTEKRSYKSYQSFIYKNSFQHDFKLEIYAVINSYKYMFFSVG